MSSSHRDSQDVWTSWLWRVPVLARARRTRVRRGRLARWPEHPRDPSSRHPNSPRQTCARKPRFRRQQRPVLRGSVGPTYSPPLLPRPSTTRFPRKIPLPHHNPGSINRRLGELKSTVVGENASPQWLAFFFWYSAACLRRSLRVSRVPFSHRPPSALSRAARHARRRGR